jgi:hypothetical protein
LFLKKSAPGPKFSSFVLSPAEKEPIRRLGRMLLTSFLSDESLLRVGVCPHKVTMLKVSKHVAQMVVNMREIAFIVVIV